MEKKEVMERKNFENIEKIEEKEGLKEEIIKGREKGRERNEVMEGLKRGEIDIVIGKNEMFKEKVEYKDMVFVIIEEKKSLGVNKRIMMKEKG